MRTDTPGCTVSRHRHWVCYAALSLDVNRMCRRSLLPIAQAVGGKLGPLPRRGRSACEGGVDLLGAQADFGQNLAGVRAEHGPSAPDA